MTNADVAQAAAGQTLHDRDSKDSVKGLQLRCFENKKVFYLYYRNKAGRERRPKIGVAGTMTLSEARRVAKAWLLQVALGNDPSVDRQEERKERTVKELFDLCFAEHWSQERYVKSGWSYEAKRLFETHIEPKFGTCGIESLTVPELQLWHATYRARPFAGNRALNVLTKIYSFAEEKQWRPQNTNPCNLVKPFKEESRDRYATREEIQALGALLEEEQKKWPAAAAFLYLLIFTGSRPRAIARATWDQLREIDVKGQKFGILKFDGKTGRETVVLPPQAMAAISSLPRCEGQTITGIGMPRKLWNRIREKAGCPDLWARDLRRTFATVGMSGGEAMSAISEILNHKSTQTTKIYAKLQDEARIETAAKIATQMATLLTAGR